MPVLEGPAAHSGGESWQQKFSQGSGEIEAPSAPYHGWHRTWHLHPGLSSSGAFETTAPVVSSVLLARPWDAPALRSESAAGPMGWRAALEGVTEVSDEPWAFELDKRNGRLKCLACCASARGECGLDSCGMKPPPLQPEFLSSAHPGESLRDPALVQQHVEYAYEQLRAHQGCVRRSAVSRANCA